MKHIVVVRHAIAENRLDAAASGTGDAARRLTDEGRKKLRKAAIGLQCAAPDIQAFISSPLRRAVETANLLAQPYGQRPVVQSESLAPGGAWRGLPADLQSYPDDCCVALVGHEPCLGELVCWLLTGDAGRPFVQLKKGGACLIDFDGEVVPGAGQLRWVLTPSQLRDVGRGE